MDALPDPNIRLWVETWKRAGPELERIRRQELRALRTIDAVTALDGWTQFVRENSPPASYSGLVEQQRLFSLLRR
jgi:hypothetical protein